MHLIATLAIVAGGLHGIVMKGPTQPVCRAGHQDALNFHIDTGIR